MKVTRIFHSHTDRQQAQPLFLEIIQASPQVSNPGDNVTIQGFIGPINGGVNPVTGGVNLVAWLTDAQGNLTILPQASVQVFPDLALLPPFVAHWTCNFTTPNLPAGCTFLFTVEGEVTTELNPRRGTTVAQTISLQVKVANAPVALTVSITSPGNGATVSTVFSPTGTFSPFTSNGAPVTVTASMADVNGNTYNPVANPALTPVPPPPANPTSGTWQCTFGTPTRPLPVGAYLLTAQSQDNTGATSTPSTISVTVSRNQGG